MFPTMKNTVTRVSQLILLMTFVCTGFAQTQYSNIYTTDFNSPGTGPAAYPGGSYTAGSLYFTTGTYQDGWYANPVDTNASIFYSQFAGITTIAATNTQVLFIGGQNITDQPPIAVNNYATRYYNTSSNSIHFDSTFYLDPGTGTKDTFGWTLFNTAGKQLMSINLNPIDTAGVITYSLGATSFANDSDLSNQSLNLNNGQPLAALNATNWYHLGFDIMNIGVSSSQTISVFNMTGATPTLQGTTSILYADFTPSDVNDGNTNIASIATTYTLTDTTTNGSGQYTGYGSNTMYMSTFSASSITVVPEPKTWILFGLSGVVLTVVLRRRTSRG